MATVKETLESGIKPISIDFSKVCFFEANKNIYRSFLTVNSLDLGVLTYEQYRFVARRTKVGEALVKRHLEKLFRYIAKTYQTDKSTFCYTVPVYARLLVENTLLTILMELKALYPEVPMKKICIEISADVLYEELDGLSEKIELLRELGVKIALCEVGDRFCPAFRLAEISFDFAFLDSYTTDSLENDSMERIAGSMVRYLHSLGVTVVAPMLDTQLKIDNARTVGVDGYTDGTLIDADEKGGTR